MPKKPKRDKPLGILDMALGIIAITAKPQSFNEFAQNYRQKDSPIGKLSQLFLHFYQRKD